MIRSRKFLSWIPADPSISREDGASGSNETSARVNEVSLERASNREAEQTGSVIAADCRL